MTLENKILTRLNNLASAIVSKINSKITAHNESSTAHNDIRTNYVKNADKNNHNHGQIDKDGKITSTTNNVSKVVVTESNGTVYAANKLPLGNVTHQDISGKLNKNLTSAHAGKFLKVQSNGDIEPEGVNVPEVNVVQTKSSGDKIGSINGVNLFCNENTTYSVATESNAGLMSTADKTKLKYINEGASKVSFHRELNEGTLMGTLTINDIPYELYCTSSAVRYSGNNGIAVDQNNQIIHTNSIGAQNTAGIFKVKYDGQGHITEATPITKNDIANLGVAITDNDTTYSAGSGLQLGNNNTFSIKEVSSNDIVQLSESGHQFKGINLTALPIGTKITQKGINDCIDGRLQELQLSDSSQNESINFLKNFSQAYATLQGQGTSNARFTKDSYVLCTKIGRLCILDIHLKGSNALPVTASGSTPPNVCTIPEGYRPMEYKVVTWINAVSNGTIQTGGNGNTNLRYQNLGKETSNIIICQMIYFVAE